MVASTLSAICRRSRVHEDHALGAGLHDDVAARAGDHVEVRTNLDEIETVRRLRAAVGRLWTAATGRLPRKRMWSPPDEDGRDCEQV